MKIAVVGAGYVGLVVAVCFSCNGHQVVCLEKNAARCKILNAGQCPILEKELPLMLKNAIKSNKIRFTTNAEDAIPSAELIFITVGTPSGEDGQADLSAIYTVARDIGKMRKTAEQL